VERMELSDLIFRCATFSSPPGPATPYMQSLWVILFSKMSDQQFEIKIIDLHWIKNEDDPRDLCAHGHVYLKIGDEIISDKETGDWTLSSTALSLMRTIESDYKKDDYGNQLLPHCGHFFIADDKNETVTIQGCDTGIDWIIIHNDGIIEHISNRVKRGQLIKKTIKE
jgi:hypothetical protein